MAPRDGSPPPSTIGVTRALPDRTSTTLSADALRPALGFATPANHHRTPAPNDVAPATDADALAYLWSVDPSRRRIRLGRGWSGPQARSADHLAAAHGSPVGPPTPRAAAPSATDRRATRRPGCRSSLGGSRSRDPQRMSQMQAGTTLGDDVGRPLPAPRRLHCHLGGRSAGGDDLAGQVRGAIDPTPRHPLPVLVQHDHHRLAPVQVDSYVRSHESLLARGFLSATRASSEAKDTTILAVTNRRPSARR